MPYNNNKHLSYIISVGQEFGRGLAMWFWLRVLDEVAVKVLAGLQSSESMTRSGRATP